MTYTKKNSKTNFLNKRLYLSIVMVFVIAATSVSCSKPSKTAKVENKTEVATETKNNTNQEKASTLHESTTSNDAKADTNTNDSKEITNSTPNANTSKSAPVSSSKTNTKSTTNNSSGSSQTTNTNTTPASSTANPAPSPAPISYTYGNTSSNLVNGGFAAYSENSIYYTGGGLYKINQDSTTPTKISNSSGICYNIIGDWIYYSNFLGDAGIFKIKKDGSNKTKISSDVSDFISVVNDWIYYQTPSNGNLLLYKIKTDGTCKTTLDFSMKNTLTNIDHPELIVAGNCIYLDLFNISNHTHGLYRVATDGSSVNKVLDGSCYNFSIDGNYIYYLKNGFKEIGRANLDGSNQTTIYKASSEGFRIYSINISNGYIYFSSDHQSSSEQYQGIYKINTDGSNFTKLSNINTKHLCVVSNWIYFDCTVNDNRGFMKMKTDGTQVSSIN